MAGTIDASANYLIWSNTETVTLSLQRPGPAVVTISVPYVKRRSVEGGPNTIGGIALEGTEIVFNIPAVLVVNAGVTYDINDGDIITDADGNRFAVFNATLNTFASRWRCVTRQIPS